jgi:hypothetical protein
MAKEILIITALSCEAAPLIKAYEARPLRENPCAERFQVFYRNGVYIATSGIGKIRSATATSALMTSLFPDLYRGGESPLDSTKSLNLLPVTTHRIFWIVAVLTSLNGLFSSFFFLVSP